MSIPLHEIGARLAMLNILRRIELNKLALSAGLHFGQLPILEYIIRNEGCTQREIADILRVTPASIAISTKRLQKAGLIQKQTDESNLRCNMLSVTEKGAGLAQRCREHFDEFDKKLFTGFADQELLVMKSHLDCLIANISEGKEGGVNMYTITALENEAGKSEHKKR